jgi:serine/threonine protein kinase
MNSRKNPWTESWELIRALGKGGQGETFLLRALADANRRGVLKKLKNQKSVQARGRMRIEVTNLEALSYLRIKVPAVYESNVAQFAEADVPLYFVMQYVDGPTLEELVTADGPYSLDRAAAMVIDLGTTIGAAHGEGVLHRDLKPANIIVRDPATADLVIVDYGLSFNRDDDAETVTRTDEQFRNEFLALGETNTPGGNKRDPRIDVTALCGVLYFCLSGQVPGHLVDGRGRPPHKRDGVRSVRHYISGDPRCNHVEMLLDRGFAPDIECRFQSCSELIDRLRHVLGSARGELEDPTVLAASLGKQLRERDRKTQLEAQKIACRNLIGGPLTQVLLKYHQKIPPFSIVAHHTGQVRAESLPNGFEPLEIGVVYAVRHNLHGTKAIHTVYGAEGNEIVMLAQLTEGGRPSLQTGKVLANDKWEKVLWFTADEVPPVEVLDNILKSYISLAMHELADSALGKGVDRSMN